MGTAVLVPDGAVTRLITAVLAVKMASAHVPAATLVMFQLTGLAGRMARPVKEVPLETVVLLKDTAVRPMTSVLLVVSPTSELVLPKLIFPLTAFVARTAKFAKAASMAIAVPRKDTVAKTATAVQAASPSSAHALLRPTSLPTASAVRMVRFAKEAHTVTAVLPKAIAVRRRVIVTQDARARSEVATALLGTSQRMANVARMERLARAAPLATVALLRAGAERRRIIAVRVVNPALGLVMPQLVMFLLMEAVARMERFVRVVSGVIVAPRTATVARVMTTAVMDVRQPMVSALVSLLMLNVVQGTARLV